MATTRLGAGEIAGLDPYKFMAVIGKRVIHPGGRASTESLLTRSGITDKSRVLDVGCGVATTAVEIARRYRAHVTAVDVAALMLARAEENVRAAQLSDLVTVERGDILDLGFADGAFDVVIAEAVTMFVDRRRATSELVRVTKPGGRVLSTEFYWRQPPSDEARDIFMGQVCPGMQFDSVDDWIDLYGSAGLAGIETETGPFEMMTARGFLADEGLLRCLRIMGRVARRPAHVRKMAWLMPRMARAVPYLGYIVVAGTKPLSKAGDADERGHASERRGVAVARAR
jgi:SAM-dependent methyltransferase